MRKSAIIFQAIILCFFFSEGIIFAGEGSLDFKPGTEPDGFRGIKWGTNISTLKSMKYLKTDPSYGGIKIYSRKGDDLKIGGAKLASIDYGFWESRCSHVRICYEGSENHYALKAAVSEKYGIGYKSNPFIEQYLWRGNITKIFLKYSESSGCLDMISAKMLEKQEDSELQKAKKGAETGF